MDSGEVFHASQITLYIKKLVDKTRAVANNFPRFAKCF